MNQNVINPIGLKGKEELQHIQELMNKLTPITEIVRNSVVEITKKGADGKIYAIVRENHNYFIKVATLKKGVLVTEDFQYIGGLQNKNEEVHPTYAKALKRLNMKLISLAEAFGDHSPNFEGYSSFADESYMGIAVESQKNDTFEDTTEITEDEEVIDEICEGCGAEEIEETTELYNEDYHIKGFAPSIAKALNEDDGQYGNTHILPKGIENVFETLDDIKKKV